MNDPIADLLRLAGPRTVVPVERTERVRAAARAAWLASVRRRRRIRVATALAIAAGLAALAVAIPRLGPSPLAVSPPDVVASVETAPGTPAGAPILAGASLETEPQSIVVLRLKAGGTVRLAGETRVRLLSAGHFRLDRGMVYVDTGTASVPLRVVTRWGVLRDIGTAFEVRVTGEDLRVRVRNGIVAVKTSQASTPEERVEAGTELTLAAGAITRREVAREGPEWSWALGGAEPAFDIDGRSLREFLAWAAREKRLALRFAPESLGAKTARTILHGSVARMTPDEALRAVLPTTSVHASTEGAVLVVRSRR